MHKNHLVLFQLWHCAATLEDQVLTHLFIPPMPDFFSGKGSEQER